MINVQCPNCVTPLDFADDRAGTKVHCPHCRQKLLLPMPDPRAKTILAQEIDPPPNLIFLPDEPPPLPASDNPPSRKRRLASIKRRSSSFGLGMGGALQFGGLVCLLIAGVLFLRGKTLLAQAQHDRLIAEQMLGAFGGGDFAQFLPPDPRRGDGIQSVLFGSIVLLVAVGLIIYGRMKLSWYECSECGSKLAHRDVRSCPQCRTEF